MLLQYSLFCIYPIIQPLEYTLIVIYYAKKRKLKLHLLFIYDIITA